MENFILCAVDNVWFGSSLTFSPYIFLLGLPRHQDFGREVEGGLPKSKSLKQGCIGNRLILLLFQKSQFLRQMNWNDRYFRIIPLTHIHVPTDTNTRALTHTHTHTHNLDFSADYGRTLHCSCLNLIPTRLLLLCLLLCYVLLVRQLYFSSYNQVSLDQYYKYQIL